MEFGLLDGGKVGEHASIGFAEISEIFVTHDTFFFGTEPYDKT